MKKTEKIRTTGIIDGEVNENGDAIWYYVLVERDGKLVKASSSFYSLCGERLPKGKTVVVDYWINRAGVPMVKIYDEKLISLMKDKDMHVELGMLIGFIVLFILVGIVCHFTE